MFVRSLRYPARTALQTAASRTALLAPRAAVATAWRWQSAAAAATGGLKMPEKQTPMFCFQCEQTENHTGCTTIGNCGKTPVTAAMQDLLVYQLKGLGQWATLARSVGVSNKDLYDSSVFTIHALFSTLTNVNFDSTRFAPMSKQCDEFKRQVRGMYEAACKKQGISPVNPEGPARYTPPSFDVETLHREGESIGLFERRKELGDEVLGLQELLTFGLKGVAAYASHAHALGNDNDQVFADIQYSLGYLGDHTSAGAKHDPADLLKHVDLAGSTNFTVMGMLDTSHCATFGDPVPTSVRTTPVAGKAILVSGHDLKDLEELLKQTEGKGINIYTHGEMLPAHGYPGLKKYKHLVGNYGGAWQLQKIEFAKFPGPIVMTTNCLIEPRPSYRDRIFTMNEVGWENIQHITNRDYSKVIKIAQDMEGFKDTAAEQSVMVGFGRKTVLSVADKVLEAVAQNNLKHIFLIGGCDGAEGERSYYKKLAESLPQEALVLTLGCGKYRFNKQKFGNLPNTEIPRLLDMGQCNDAYGAIVVASELAKALNTDVNSLPLSLALSWFEQKAVAVLLTLLHLGVKNIRIGPALPAFVTPATLNLLVQTYGLKPVNVESVEQDRDLMMSNA